MTPQRTPEPTIPMSRPELDQVRTFQSPFYYIVDLWSMFYDNNNNYLTTTNLIYDIKNKVVGKRYPDK
jgi:hypothetical protein